MVDAILDNDGFGLGLVSGIYISKLSNICYQLILLNFDNCALKALKYLYLYYSIYPFYYEELVIFYK